MAHHRSAKQIYTDLIIKLQLVQNFHVAHAALLCFLALILIVISSLYLPPGVDWRGTYRPAALALLSGKSPYSVNIFYSAPWSLIPLVPFALLPENLGRAILFLVSIAAFGYTAIQLGAKTITLVAFLLSPPVLHCLLNSNIEWLPLLGFVLPPQVGLFFLFIKPQIGLGVGFFWLIEAWRKGGFREIGRIFWPVSAAFLISFFIFGLWPLRFQDTLALTEEYNASLWPGTIPIGLVLLGASVSKRNIKYAMASAPFLSPYVLLHTWSGALVSIVAQPVETLAAVIGLWIMVILRAYA